MKKCGGCCLGIFLFILLFPVIILICICNVDVSETTTDFSPVTEQEAVAYQVYQFVIEHKGTKEFACAWLGNMEHESGIDPTAIQSHLAFNVSWAYDPSCDGYAFGLAQWDGGRRVNLLNFAKEQKKDWKNADVQLLYAWEHDGSDSQLLQNMSKNSNLEQLTVDILMKWERAGTRGNSIEKAGRITCAKNWYDRFLKGSMSAGSKNTGGISTSGGKIDILEKKLGVCVNNGQCYGLTAYYVQELGGPQMMGSGKMYAWSIGTDYDWNKYGWEVKINPNVKDLKAGDVINWYGGGAISPGIFGHTGIVRGVNKDGTFDTYEQNAEQGQICAKYTRTANSARIASLVRKK